MSAERLASDPVVFPLRAGRGRVALHAGGFRHPSGFRRDLFTAYGDVTHLVSSPRSIRIGTTRGVFGIPRSYFRQPADADLLLRAIAERIAQEPSGAMQLARMAEIESTLRAPAAHWASRTLLLLCLAAYGLEAWLGPIVHHAGFFSASLVAEGEPWRLLTANLIHADALHLAFNVLGIGAIGGLAERALGGARTVFVMGISAIGAMLAGVLAHYEMVVGASGILTGLFGALIWLELRFPERLPATWRIPRRLLWLVLLLQGVLDLALPFVAGAAHLGGLVAGFGAAALCAGPGLRREPLAPALRVASALVLAVTLVSIALAARLAAGGAAIEQHAVRLLRIERMTPYVLNDTAWLIATSERPTAAALAHADALAERAVAETERLDPNLLDTLAEVQFQLGEEDEAVGTIDEAIALAPGVAYFREQRRRFTGEREASDRPAPPDSYVVPELAPEEAPFAPDLDDREAPGISI